MKRIILIVLAFSALSAFGQQDAQFTQNFANKLYNNPAYAGMNGAICGTLLGRQQWLGFDGAPRTGLLSVHAPIPSTLIPVPMIKLGVGLSVSNDQIGPVSTNIFKLAVSNRFWIDDVGTISVGLGLGAIGVVVDGSGFVGPDGDGSIEADPNLLGAPGSGKDYGFDLDAGVYFRSADNKIWAGAAMQHLAPSDLEGQIDQTTGSSNKYSITQHLYVMGGYRIQGLVPDWEFEPSIFLKTELSTTQFDFNAKATYKDMIWGGLSYRIQDAVSPMAGYKHDFGKAGVGKIGVSYDLNTSKLRSYNSGTVELFLNYCFTITPKPKITIHKNPRWL